MPALAESLSQASGVVHMLTIQLEDPRLIVVEAIDAVMPHDPIPDHWTLQHLHQSSPELPHQRRAITFAFPGSQNFQDH